MINNIANHARQVFNLHCLCNILVKISKIKVCNPSSFKKTGFVTSLTKQCHVLFEITFHMCFFSLSHICSSLLGSLMEANRFK